MNLEQMSKPELIEYIQDLQRQLEAYNKSPGSYNLALNLQSSELLKQRFESSQAKNPAFSLRSFAQKVGISAGRISEILNGQYLMSAEMAQKIVDKIDFEPEERKLFLQAVAEENANSEELRDFHRKMAEKSNLFSKKDMRHLSAEKEVEHLDHWEFYGIMTTLEMKACEHTPEWIAQIMQMEESDVKARLEIMTKLKIVEVKDGKYYLAPSSNFNDGSNTSPRASQIAATKCSASAFKYMSERFEQQVYAGESGDSSQTVYFFLKAIDSSKVGKVPEFIAQSAYKSLEEMAESGNIDSVYMVNVSFLKV